MLSSLTHRPFAFLWSGQTISRLGDNLYRIALAWWVLEETGSATAMGTVLIFSFTPMLIFLLIGGVAADRFSRMKVMLISDIARGILVCLVALLSFLDLLELWHIYALSLAFGFADAFFQPAYAAAVPQITPSSLLPSANALASMSAQVSGIAGPALGAWIYKIGGTSLAFLLNGLSFFIAAACLLPLLGDDGKNPATPGDIRSAISDLQEGIRTVRKSPWLWISILLAGLTNMVISGPVAITIPFFVKTTLNAGVDTLGWLLSIFSLGMVAAALVMGRMKRYRRRGLLTYLTWIAAAIMVAVAGMTTTVPAAAAALFAAGMGISAGSLVWVNVLQELVPGELLGRVSSVDALGSFVLLPVGYALTGWLTDLVGAPIVLISGGLLAALSIALGLLHPSIRNLE